MIFVENSVGIHNRIFGGIKSLSEEKQTCIQSHWIARIKECVIDPQNDYLETNLNAIQSLLGLKHGRELISGCAMSILRYCGVALYLSCGMVNSSSTAENEEEVVKLAILIEKNIVQDRSNLDIEHDTFTDEIKYFVRHILEVAKVSDFPVYQVAFN